jgi:hypothetical protein
VNALQWISISIRGVALRRRLTEMRTLSLFLIACGLSFAQNVATPVFICLSASASATVYTCTPSPLAAFPAGVPVSANWIPDVTNTTTTPTLNLGPGAKPLKDAAGNNPKVGAIVANAIYTVVIEAGGTNLRVLGGPLAPVVQQTTMALTSAQIKALHGTPITVVVAQGAGTFVQFVESACEFTFVSTQYLLGGRVSFQLNGIDVSMGISQAVIDSLVATQPLNTMGLTATGAAPAVANLGNAAINAALLFTNASVTEYTTGDGTLSCSVSYRVLTGY